MDDRPQQRILTLIAIALTFASGATDVASYTRLGNVFTSVMTGNIVLLGRLDQQVKIRGFRIELGEIEAVLAQHSPIRESVVVAREDEPGQKRLVAYVVADEANRPTVSDLRNLVGGTLPEYMIPSDFTVLDAMPMTTSSRRMVFWPLSILLFSTTPTMVPLTSYSPRW